MGIKKYMLPVEEVDMDAVKYEPGVIRAPHITGYTLKLFVKLIEAPVLGPLIMSYLKKQNRIPEHLQNTVIPEKPMFYPEFPPQGLEHGVTVLEEESAPITRVESALKCLPLSDPASSWTSDSSPFLYWKIRDFALAYQSGSVTPSMVAEYVIAGVEEFNNKEPPMPLLISFSAEEVRNQAEASTQRFKEGKPLSILDGIFVAIKDDIDCLPYPSKGATTWFHKVRPVKQDAVCVSRLRSCGVVFIGKANMHETGLGTTGNNPNYGTTRNPHDLGRYTGGSSSGPAALVAAGLCSAALGTDGGGCVKMEISLQNRSFRGLSSSCLPNLSSDDNANHLASMRLGKYTEWFNDVYSTDISDRCEDVLNMLSKTHGCETVEVVIPELNEMRTSHILAIGSESLCSLFPDYVAGNTSQMTLDTRTNLAFFRSFSASDYVAAARLRRRLMYYHIEIFKKVDVIVTPTTGMTAPLIPSSALKFGESNLEVSGYLMRFILAGNLLGLPAITVPVGHDKQGLPIGLQLIGRPWAEASILRLASAVEELCVGSRKRPSTFFNILKAK